MNNNVKNGMYTFKETDVSFSFYTDLNAVKKMRFVQMVTNYIVDDKNYNSIIRDLMFDFEIVDIFTDIDLTEISESNNSLDKIEEFLSETKVVDIVKSNMAEGLLETLNKAVDDNISYRTGVQRNNFSDALSNLFVTLNKKISDIDIENLMEMAQKINSMTGDFSAESILKAYANSDLYKKESKNLHNRRSEQKNLLMEL